MEYHCNNVGMMIGEKFILEQSTRIINPDLVLCYGSQILKALRYLPDAGTVHRDIKPQNVLLTEKNTVKICDFGMSLEDEESEEPIAAEGVKVGTPYYISPEQNRDPEKADQRSDLYSTAVMLYRMLTGELPGMKSFLLSRINPLYDSRWDDFFIKALEWNPANRFQSAMEMAASLAHLELHWENRKSGACGTILAGSTESARIRLPVRAAPIRVSGSKAREMFEADGLWRPLRYTDNIFIQQHENTVLDKTTGLIWLLQDDDLPVDRNGADAIITALNANRFMGICSWRLPTVNELLTLVNDPVLPESHCSPALFQSGSNGFWSCDHRSAGTSWYVNIGMGYAGWQENGCRYAVRAVATSAEK